MFGAVVADDDLLQIGGNKQIFPIAVDRADRVLVLSMLPHKRVFSFLR